MYVLLLDTKKRLHKFIESLSPKEVSECRFILAADDLHIDDFPKKSKIKNMHFLMPPSYIIGSYYTALHDAPKGHTKEAEENYSKEYFNYLASVCCRLGFNYMGRKYLFDEKNIIICIGDLEKEYNIHKFLKKEFNFLYPDIEVFTYKDWEKDEKKVRKYKPENINRMKEQVSYEGAMLARKMAELTSCRNEASKFEFIKP